MATTNIYILRLQGGRFYVGKSNNIAQRYQQHLQGEGCSWTKLYKPVSLERTILNASPFEEDKYTKEYMAKYGVDKVRGGTYVSVDLDSNLKATLMREIWAATDCCTRCGRKGHFVQACATSTDICGNYIDVRREAPKAAAAVRAAASQLLVHHHLTTPPPQQRSLRHCSHSSYQPAVKTGIVWSNRYKRHINTAIYEDDEDDGDEDEDEDDEGEDDEEDEDDDDEHDDYSEPQKITFANIACKNPPYLSVDSAKVMIYNYILQQRTNGKKNADFPISVHYKDSFGDIKSDLLAFMSDTFQGVKWRILSTSSYQYFIRVEWQ
jgi:predicted GIY-YIG superfamily endonuclease